ncbi:uncharacterized protein LOC106644605 [Copidosoma floridanum]|uniref:uncharacterized protein LOC106644605 n=1 Tax=Copidosoma floridanum TaxID=29053 RepID=UPI000C6F7D47|nr:uncharacterized protein LOC106644605 [Copidosoma floridanum]
MDNLSSGDMRNIKYKYLHMENNAFKELGIKERAGEIKFVSSNSNELSYDFTLDVKNWLSNGVWNHSCFLGLKDVFGTYCTKYLDRRELTQFFGSIQNYQRDAYERDLSELLLKTAVPMLKESLGPESKEFTSIYKMISAICQVVNIKVPALVHLTD